MASRSRRAIPRVTYQEVEELGSPRRGRKGKGRKTNRASRKMAQQGRQPSSAHYLGYCEDGETVEMIAAKFAALEEFEKQKREAAAAAANGAADDGAAAHAPKADDGAAGGAEEGGAADADATQLEQQDLE